MATTHINTLSLHDALPISNGGHLHQKNREYTFGSQCCVELKPSGNIVANLKNGVPVDAVARGAGNGCQGVDQGRTSGKGGGKGPAETGQHGAVDNIANDGQSIQV